MARNTRAQKDRVAFTVSSAFHFMSCLGPLTTQLALGLEPIILA